MGIMFGFETYINSSEGFSVKSCYFHLSSSRDSLSSNKAFQRLWLRDIPLRFRFLLGGSYKVICQLEINSVREG